MRFQILQLTLAICILPFVITAQTVTDIDGNVYKTVVIGNQTWMAENLQTLRFNNGDYIQTTLPADQDITEEIDPVYQWTYGGNDIFLDTFGRLYTWYAAVDERGLCPTGWHLPSNEEVVAMVLYLGNQGHSCTGSGYHIAKTLASKFHWTADTNNCTVGNNPELNNLTGFTAVPAGARNSQYSYFTNFGNVQYWWTSDEMSSDATRAIGRWVIYRGTYVDQTNWVKISGLSVRCIKDNVTATTEVDEEIRINIHPNPVADKLFIDNPESNEGIIEVFSITAELVLRTTLHSNDQSIDVSYLIPGTYLIKISGKDYSIERMILKE